MIVEEGSDCCAPGATPGCDNAACVNAVCAIDAFCCEAVWDEFCAGCALGQPSFDGLPCNPAVAPCACPACGDGLCNGLEDCLSCAADCGECVCGSGTCDPGESCTGCPSDCGSCSGDCCETHDGAGCDDAWCTNFVCAADPFCCETEWDGQCVGA